MFKMIALIFQGIEGFVLDLPSGTPTAHDLIRIVFCHSKIGNPAEVLYLIRGNFPCLLIYFFLTKISVQFFRGKKAGSIQTQ